MSESLPKWLLAGTALLLSSWAFHLAADPAARIYRERFVTRRVVLPGQWAPPADPRGSNQAVENRVRRPRLVLPFKRTDAFRVRLFYILEGGAPARVRFAGEEAALLEPSPAWRKAVFDTPRVRAGEKREIAFEVPEGGRLILRRVDYRNYVFRLGNALLLKPGGASRAAYGPAALLGMLIGLAAVIGGAALLARRRGEESLSPRRAALSAGGLSVVLILPQGVSPYPLHVQPSFLAACLLASAAAGALRGRRGRVRALLPRVALAGAATLAALAAAEVGLRLWDPPMSRPRILGYGMYSPDYGWRNRPGVRGWQVDIGYHIRINRHGHRGPDYPVEKPPGEFRILGLGDSFAFGWGVEEEETFLRVLERRLREAGHNVRVLNAAVPAWHSAQSLHYLRREGFRFGPDVVVMSFFMDDVLYKTVEKLRASPKAEETRREEIALRRRRNSLAHRSRLYNLWFNYRKIHRASRRHRGSNPYPTFEDERKWLLNMGVHRNFDQFPKRVEELRRMLAQWRRTRDELGIPVLLTFIPAGGALHFPEFQGHARALRRLAGEMGFPYVDVVAALEKHPEPGKLYLHPRDGHMGPAGHALMGEALARKILAGGWLERAGAGRTAPPGPAR